MNIIRPIAGLMINDWSAKEASILCGYFVGLELHNNYGKTLFYASFKFARNSSWSSKINDEIKIFGKAFLKFILFRF